MMTTLHKFLQRYHVPQAFLAAVIAWVSVLITFAITANLLGGESNNSVSYSPDPVGDFIKGIFLYGGLTGMIVFPSCLVLVYPIYLVMPRRVFMWSPLWASIVGALVGPVVMYGWVAVAIWQPILPLGMAAIILGLPAMGAGIAFGFSFTKLVARKFRRVELEGKSITV